MSPLGRIQSEEGRQVDPAPSMIIAQLIVSMCGMTQYSVVLVSDPLSPVASGKADETLFSETGVVVLQ